VAEDPLELHAAGAPAWRIMEAIERRRREASQLAPPAPAPLEHRPDYLLCTDPGWCCSTSGPLAITCAIDGQDWPCDVKRAHHNDSENRRTQRWVAGRLERSYARGY
jgi:hypothetical protein